MATIYSNRNDNVGSHTTVSPSSTSTWAGGVVPVAADTVYIVGRRTQINMAAFAKWTGTKTITVDSTSNFASTGFFYVQTNGGEIVKINYTSTTATTFIGCTLDESDPFYAWNSGQTLPDNAYVHNPAYIITVNVGQTFECDVLYIQEGGWLFLNGGTLKINNYAGVRDGRLVARGNSTITLSRPSASVTAIGYLVAENYPISVLDLAGDENRVYATTTSTLSKDACYIDIGSTTNGSFAVGDEIAVFETDQYRFRNRGYTGYRDVSANFANLDEGFDVVGVQANKLWIARKNGADGDIKAVTTVGAQKVLEVLPQSVYFNAGEKVVINNAAYTIDSVEDSEFPLYEYDFTNPSTSLSDFWVNDSTHIYSSGWVIESGVGIRNTAGAYRELVNKYFWTREVIIEADMSPLSGYYSGSRSTNAFGILAAYDPSFRWGHRGYDGFKTDYLVISEADQDFYYHIRAMSNYANNRPDRVTDVLNAIRLPHTYKVVNRKAHTIAYMDGQELTTEYRRDGHFKGLVGIYTNANTNFRCKALRIKQATQKLYITTSDSFTVGQNVRTSGADHDHVSGSRVVKLASINTGDGNHRDLAFAYRGQYGNGEWPLMIQVNGTNTTNASMPYVHNHDMNVDYYYNLGDSTTAKSFTIDLMSQKTFTHVSFVPRVNDYSEFYGYNGVAVYGSNDLTNWTTLYGPTNDTKKWYYATYNRMAYYPTGTVSYRYVKFETKGAQQGTYPTNRYDNIGVHNFSEGYTLSLNNASDFNIGDKITVMSDSGYSWCGREYEAYKAITSGVDPEEYFHGGWMLECTITNKVGNKIYLDKPVFWGYIEGDDSVTIVKTNRTLTVQGTISPSGSNNDWRWGILQINDGSNLARKTILKNIRMMYMGSYRYTGSTTANRGAIVVYSDDYWNHPLIDGCSIPVSSDGTVWGGNVSGSSTSGCVIRNCYFGQAVTGLAMYNTSSYAGSAIFNTKFNSVLNGFYGTYVRALAFNYNEFSMGDIGIHVDGYRVDRGIIPAPREIIGNYIKGTSNSGIRLYDETEGPRRSPRTKILNNKIRATDDYACVGQTFSGNPYINTNAMAEHTGSRLSRYRNEGPFSEGDTSSDLSWTTVQQNFGKFGFDLAHTVYYYAARYTQDPSMRGITRIFTVQGDAYFWALGMELDVLEDDIPFEIKVKFDYRIPLMGNLQDDGTDDGRLRIYSLQRGVVTQLQYGIVPASCGTGWNTFEGTFSNFSQLEGHCGVFLNRAAQNGYIDIKNGYAELRTDYPEKIKVVGNTFNLDRIWDQYGEYRDTRPLTGPTRTINIKRLKL